MLKAWKIHNEHRWAIFTQTDPIILPSPPSPQSTPQATLLSFALYLSELSIMIAKAEQRSRCLFDEQKATWANLSLNKEHCAWLDDDMNHLAKEDKKLDAILEQARICREDAEGWLIQ